MMSNRGPGVRHPLTEQFMAAIAVSDPERASSGDYPEDAVVALGCRGGSAAIFGWVDSIDDLAGVLTVMCVYRDGKRLDHDLHRLHLCMDEVISIRFVDPTEVPTRTPVA